MRPLCSLAVVLAFTAAAPAQAKRGEMPGIDTAAEMSLRKALLFMGAATP